MQYILLIYSRESDREARQKDPAAAKAVMEDYFAYNKEAQQAGVFVGGDALHPVATATTVRLAEGKVMHTDGPFAETKEQLGGYYLLECSDLDDALAWAAKCPAVKHGQAIEVRPVMKFD